MTTGALGRYGNDLRKGQGFDRPLKAYLRWRYGPRRQPGVPVSDRLRELPNRLSTRRRHVQWLAPLYATGTVALWYPVLMPRREWAALTLAVVLAIGYLLWLDAYDGPLARHLGVTSERGAIIDADSDKRAAMATYGSLMLTLTLGFGWLGLAFTALALARGGLDLKLAHLRQQEIEVAEAIRGLGGQPPAVKSGPGGKFKFFSDAVAMVAGALAGWQQLLWHNGFGLLLLVFAALLVACRFAPMSITEHGRNLTAARVALDALQANAR